MYPVLARNADHCDYRWANTSYDLPRTLQEFECRYVVVGEMLDHPFTVNVLL